MNQQQLTLDIFRQNDLAYTTCHINYEIGSVVLPFLYSDYFNKTTIDFISQLLELENSTICPVTYNVDILQVFTNYFACFEQFISALYAILYFYKVSNIIPDEKESIKLFRLDYKNTINKIFETISISKMEYNRTGLAKKIEELEDARNYILYGNIGKIKIRKTKLPQFPLTIHYEDIMEEIDIIVNFINYFRYIFPNIDLMPNIQIMIGETIFFKQLDEYFYKVLCPYFVNILQKHNLSISKSFILETTSIQPKLSQLAQNITIATRFKASEQVFDLIQMNKQKTNYYVQALHNIIAHDEPTKMKGKFQLPKFMLNSEDK